MNLGNLINPATIGAAAGGFFGGPTGAMIGGSLGSSLMQQQGQKEANKQNVSLAREQMAFQERMSSSAYQRSMADLDKAGLNPMLAFAQGGASAPTGQTAQVQNEALDLNPAIQKTIEVQMAKQNLNNLKASAKQIQAQTRKLNSETQAINKTMPTKEAQGEAGKLIKQGLESVTSSAKGASNMMDKGFEKAKNKYDSYKMKKAEIKQKSKYSKSQAAKDAAKARRKKWKK